MKKFDNHLEEEERLKNEIIYLTQKNDELKEENAKYDGLKRLENDRDWIEANVKILQQREEEIKERER